VLDKVRVLDAERRLSGPETVTDEENNVASPGPGLFRVLCRAACDEQHDIE
jgi:hypothetical protein